MKVKVQNINALAELERFAYDYEPVGTNEVKLRCPAHEDTRASASLNVEQNLWRCHVGSCNARGDIISMLALISQVERRTMLAELSKRYDLGVIKTISRERVEKWHAAVWDSGPLLEELRKRCVTDEMIRDARLGFDGERITIPVFDANGNCINVRRYLPGAPGPDKMKNTRGFGKIQLYNVRRLEKAKCVLICGGELKALVAQFALGDDWACVAATAGEGKWQNDWNEMLRGKKVWVCMDVDKAGRAAARKVAKAVRNDAMELRVTELGLDVSQHPKGDINDYFVDHDAGDFVRLLAASPEWKGTYEEALTKGCKQVSLRAAARKDNVGWDLEFSGVPTAADMTPYIIPRHVRVTCERDQPYCHECPVNAVHPDEHDSVKLEIRPHTDGILGLMNTHKRTQRQAILEALNMPQCKDCRMTVDTNYIVHEVRLSKCLELSSDDGSGNLMQPAVIVEHDYQLNAPYEFKGRVWPDPRTQQAVLVIEGVAESTDSLETFNPSASDLQKLKRFCPDEWTLESIKQKLDALYQELECGVTRIFGRREMHELVDMAYHSPLYLTLGRKVLNGWMNVLVMGDSAQGKSELTQSLMAHYNLGEKVDCKNATVAGLLGGLQQIGNRWFVSWGVIPTHDRRLVVLEEVKGAEPHVLQKLTDMRSSGMAEIPKIERQRAYARTRLVWISNPRGSRQIATYGFGIEAILELVGSLEDVRRFDAACIVAADEVDYEQMAQPIIDEFHFTADMCRKLILWGWTRNNVNLSDIHPLLRKEAALMCARYDESIPLVDKGTMATKLGRIAAACAVRTYSQEDGELVVRPCHVEYAVDLLNRCYTAPSFGYEEFTKTRRALTHIKKPHLVEACIRGTKHPADFGEGLLYQDTITLTDIMDWCDVDRDAAQEILSVLVRQHALRRYKRSNYVKSPAFIDLLKEWDFPESDELEF